jgi:hypothetical protein
VLLDHSRSMLFHGRINYHKVYLLGFAEMEDFGNRQSLENVVARPCEVAGKVRREPRCENNQTRHTEIVNLAVNVLGKLRISPCFGPFSLARDL